MQHLVLEGRSIEYRDLPATVAGRPVLVLLHEGLGSASMWGKFPERLAQVTGCRVLVPSRAGYGQSEPYPEPRNTRYQHREGEEALPAFLAALGVVRPVVIGHSDGGTMALLYAAAHPEAPLGIALMAPHEYTTSGSPPSTGTGTSRTACPSSPARSWPSRAWMTNTPACARSRSSPNRSPAPASWPSQTAATPPTGTSPKPCSPP
ncbi:MAG: alpha/beta fold hydrolase [Acidobacteria bacterium]|nr:alpha/beta fold hydrolase [Acidobacteriota bacterium]